MAMLRAEQHQQEAARQESAWESVCQKLPHYICHMKLGTTWENFSSTFGWKDDGGKERNSQHLKHTEVPSQHRGKGLAEELVRGAFRYCLDKKLRVYPSCSYVQKFVNDLASEEEKKIVVERMISKSAFCGPSTPFIFCRRCFLNRKLPNPGKPPILPPAKSKMYKVHQYKWQDPSDVAELLWRRHVYNSAILSMRRLFREEVALKKSLAMGLEEIKAAEAVELNEILALNEQRNIKLAEARAEREKVAMAQIEEETLKEIERKLDWENANAEKRTKEVLETIERSKTEYVTRENLEQRVEEALENPQNFDYAIDLNGINIPNPVPTKYVHSVMNSPSIYEQPLDYGPPIDGYTYKSARGRPGHSKVQRNRNSNKPRDGEEQGSEELDSAHS
uniref:Protein NATD1 n=1 Tax=Globodera rostochiensis TaxID=31243 RepID=A0A914HEI1_GLORO